VEGREGGREGGGVGLQAPEHGEKLGGEDLGEVWEGGRERGREGGISRDKWEKSRDTGR